MRTLTVFNNLSLDGFFVDRHGDMGWAHGSPDAEFDAFIAGNASSGGGELVFGRVTYEMMAGYWPTPQALEVNRVVAEGMNSLPKIVFSRTLDTASWNNTRLVKDDVVTAMRQRKEEPGDSMVILGSGAIVSQLAREGLIDEYQIIVNPVILGQGRTLFGGVETPRNLTLTESVSFANGKVFLRYRPVP